MRNVQEVSLHTKRRWEDGMLASLQWLFFRTLLWGLVTFSSQRTGQIQVQTMSGVLGRCCRCSVIVVVVVVVVVIVVVLVVVILLFLLLVLHLIVLVQQTCFF